MRRFLTAFAAAVLMLSLGTADAAEYKKMTIRAATANPQGSLHVVAIDKFKEIVEKESNGAITVQTSMAARSATNRPTSNSSATPRSISRCWRTGT